MKKLFTKLLKPQALFLMCISFLAGTVSVNAEEYKSMIRYDRVWEHVSVHWNDRQVYHVKFDGPEEINGKTYHRLVSFRTASYDYDSNRQPYLFDIDNDYYRHEGYLREEDGKVYTLVVVYDEPETDYHSIDLYNPDDYKDLESYSLEEKLIYDFTCKEGESYQGLQIEQGWVEEMNYIVKSVEYVEIDGEKHRLLRICADDEYNYGFKGEPVIEGIGIGSYGCLTTINFLHIPSCPCMDYIFNRVLSSDGKELYRAEDDFEDIPYGAFSSVGNIMEQSKDADTQLYDILGRRISTPAPGQLYIQGGKKFIGK